MSKQQHTGVVKWFNKDLGFGFLAVAPGVKQEFGIPMDRDLFVHAENIQAAYPGKVLEPEQKVSFDVQIASKGPRAINVTLIESPVPA